MIPTTGDRNKRKKYLLVLIENGQFLMAGKAAV